MTIHSSHKNRSINVYGNSLGSELKKNSLELMALNVDSKIVRFRLAERLNVRKIT